MGVMRCWECRRGHHFACSGMLCVGCTCAGEDKDEPNPLELVRLQPKWECLKTGEPT